MNRSRVTGDLASQGNIFVDIANDRVGIGSTIPTNKLDIRGVVESRSAINFHEGLWTGETTKIQLQSGYLHIEGGSNGTIFRRLSGGNCFHVTSAGHFNPAIDSTFDIGTNTVRVRNIYADTLYGDGSNLTGLSSDLENDTSPTLGGSLGTNGHFIQFPDSTTGNQNKAVFGGQLDLQIYHDGSHSYIHDGGTGNLKLRSNNFRVSNADESKMSATFQPAGAVELYHNNSKKLETTSGGVTVSDNLTLSGGNIYLADTYKLMVGTGDDLQIHHDNSNTLNIINSQNGNLRVQHGGTTKLQVLSSGIDVVGTVTADNQIVLNSGDSTPARIDLYCEVSNAHYTRLQAPAHSTYSGNVTATLPNVTGNLAVLANAADNRVVTATGTHSMTGESSLTYDGTKVLNISSSAGGFFQGTDTDGGIGLVEMGNGNVALQADTGNSIGSSKIQFFVDNSEKININSSGQLLINTTSTESGTNTKMAVCATGSAGSNPSSITNNVVATFRATGATGHAASIGILAGNTGSSAVHFGDTDNDIIGRLLYNHTSNNTSDYFEFFLQGSRRFRIQGNGNLCIGNDSNFTAGAKVEIRDTIGGGGGTGLILNDIGSSGANEGLHIEWRSGSDKQADQCRIGQSANATGSGSNFFIATNSADSGSSTERLRIDHNGDLGLGVAPNNIGSLRTLHIKGPSGQGAGIRLQDDGDTADSDDFTIYKNYVAGYLRINGTDPLIAYLNGGERFRIASSGQIGLSGANYGSSGQVLTSQGSGSAATWTTVTGTTINSNADNRIITGSGTANTLNGESSLTFDGTTLTTNGSGGINISYNGADLTMNSAGTIFTGNGGNASDPIVRNVSDTNTGFFYPSADQLAFTTGGSERMRLTAGGTGVANVLIGGTNSTTHSSADQLIVGGTSGTNGITIKSGTTSFGCLYFHDADSTAAPFGQIEYQHGNEHMDFYANQKLMMRIDGTEDEGQLRFTPNVTFSGTRNTNIVRETFILNTSESSNQAYHDNHHMSFGQTSGNWDEGTGGADTSWGLMWHYAANASATRQCRAGIAFDHKGTEQFKIWSAYGDIVFYQDLANGGSETAETCDTECARFDATGHFVPGSNNARDLGSSSKKWRNIYVMDMHFSNEGGSPNSVDGTTGNWTLQEGEDGIYMINNKNGKKYEMMLKEVQ